MVIAVVVSVVIIATSTAVKSDVDRRAAVITAIIVTRISRPVIIAVIA